MPRAGPQLRRANNNVTTRLAGCIGCKAQLAVEEVDMGVAVFRTQQAVLVRDRLARAEPDPGFDRERAGQGHVVDVDARLGGRVQHAGG